MTARPFCKAVGGKTSSLPLLLEHAPREVSTYFEPMAGGGALFWALRAENRFRHAWLNDANGELMRAYKAVRDHVEDLIFTLRGMQNTKRAFLQERAKVPELLPLVERAARFIYLNKTAFNGLYRVNKSGQFNVPFGGYKNPTICDEENLRACSEALRQVDLTGKSYLPVALVARPGDFVYLDSPYLPASDVANFTSFTPGGWKREDHERLARLFRELARRGVAVMLSNADVPEARKLYRGYEIRKTKVRRNVNSDGQGRGPVGEILVVANCGEATRAASMS